MRCRECGVISEEVEFGLCDECWANVHLCLNRPSLYRKDLLIDDDAFKRSETDDAGLE
jgi:hypothetical protein